MALALYVMCYNYEAHLIVIMLAFFHFNFKYICGVQTSTAILFRIKQRHVNRFRKIFLTLFHNPGSKLVK